MVTLREAAPWSPSTADKNYLESLVARGLLPKISSAGQPEWMAPPSSHRVPAPPQGYVVSLARLHERGFGSPPGDFIRALCTYYGVELHNFAPNAISQAAVFVVVCEGYLGVPVHWDLWIHLFWAELHTVATGATGVRRLVCAGSVMFQLREGRKDLYIPTTMTSNNADWDKGWFYLRNDGNLLPPYTDKIVAEKPLAWSWGVSPKARQDKLGIFTTALRSLAKKGLNAAAVIANFHQRRVVPLMQRSLPIYQLTSRAPFEGSRMAQEPLSAAEAAQRARRAVDCTKMAVEDDVLWAIKMRPDEGYLTFGLTHKGHRSAPPLPDVREANRLNAERQKARKDAEKETRLRKQRRRDEHQKENRRREREGLSPLPTPDSTPEPEEDDSSDDEVFFESATVARAADASPLVAATPGASPLVAATGASVPAPAPPARARVAGERAPVPAVQPPSRRSQKRKLKGVNRGTSTPAAPTLAPIKALKTRVHSTPHTEAPPLRTTLEAEASLVASYEAAMARGVERARRELGLEGAAEGRGSAPAGVAGQGRLGEPAGPDVEEEGRRARSEVVYVLADEEDMAPGFEPPCEAQALPPASAAPLLESGGAIAEETPAPAEAAAAVSSVVAAGPTAPSRLEAVEGRSIPASAGASMSGGIRGILGLDRPGIPDELVSIAENENQLWLEHHQIGTDLQNALSDALELHRTRGLQLHVQLRDLAASKVLYIADQHAHVDDLMQRNARLSSEVDQARAAINEAWAAARAHGESLSRAERERDALHAAAAERALEVERLNALLQENDASLAAAQASLRQQHEAAAAAEAQVLEHSVALEVLRSTTQEQGASLATLREESCAVRTQWSAEKERAAGLQAAVANSQARAEAVGVAYASSQQELEELREAAAAVCLEFEEDGAQSGSSLASRLRSLGDRVMGWVKNAFLLGIRKALGVVSTHYLVQLDALATGYVVAEGLDDDAAVAAVEHADANVAETAAALTTLFADEILPGSGEGDDDTSPERTVDGDGA